MAKHENRFHGHVGQHVEADVIKGGIRVSITFDADGNMVVDTNIGAEEKAE